MLKEHNDTWMLNAISDNDEGIWIIGLTGQAIRTGF